MKKVFELFDAATLLMEQLRAAVSEAEITEHTEVSDIRLRAFDLEEDAKAIRRNAYDRYNELRARKLNEQTNDG